MAGGRRLTFWGVAQFDQRLVYPTLINFFKFGINFMSNHASFIYQNRFPEKYHEKLSIEGEPQNKVAGGRRLL